MHLVWTHLDSPVDGVNDTVMAIFKTLLVNLTKESGPWQQNVHLKDAENDKKDHAAKSDFGESKAISSESTTNKVSECTKCENIEAKEGSLDDNVSEVLTEMKTKALQMSWQVKGKHELLAALLPYMDVQQVSTMSY